jgi:hypothetical protein
MFTFHLRIPFGIDARGPGTSLKPPVTALTSQPLDNWPHHRTIDSTVRPLMAPDLRRHNRVPDGRVSTAVLDRHPHRRHFNALPRALIHETDLGISLAKSTFDQRLIARQQQDIGSLDHVRSLARLRRQRSSSQGFGIIKTGPSPQLAMSTTASSSLIVAAPDAYVSRPYSIEHQLVRTERTKEGASTLEQ